MKVLIIDDHTLFRDGIAALLKSRSVKVVMAADGEKGLDILRKDKTIDITLLDLSMPKIHGIDVLKKIKTENIKTPVVILTTSSEEKDLVDCLKIGAQAYLLKDMDPDELVTALNDVMQGSIIVVKELTHILAKVLKGELDEKQTSFNQLTPREKEVLCFIAKGYSNKVIGRELDISDGTVKLHVKSILKKLSLSSRVEAAVMATQESFCDN